MTARDEGSRAASAAIHGCSCLRLPARACPSFPLVTPTWTLLARVGVTGSFHPACLDNTWHPGRHCPQLRSCVVCSCPLGRLRPVPSFSAASQPPTLSLKRAKHVQAAPQPIGHLVEHASAGC